MRSLILLFFIMCFMRIKYGISILSSFLSAFFVSISSEDKDFIPLKL